MARKLMLGRMVMASVLGAAAGSAWGTAFLSFVVGFTGGQEPYQWFVFVLACLLYGFFIALVLVWTLGLAWHASACALNWTGWFGYAAAGATAGAGLGLALSQWVFAASPTTVRIGALTWAISCSGIVAYTGWLIRRPDRDARGAADYGA